MASKSDVFCGCIPALMTPCSADGVPNFDALVAKGKELTSVGMRAVVYCGSMGDWPLLTDEQRQEGVKRLTQAGVPVVVGTGAQNPHIAAAHAAHAKKVGVAGLMVIPRVLSRGTSSAAQRHHFAGVLKAADEGSDLVLYYKHLMVLEGNPEYGHHFNPTDALSPSQKEFMGSQWQLFRTWWSQWPGAQTSRS